MAQKLAVTIVGPGSLGGAMAIALKRAGYTVKEIVYRREKRRAQTIARKAGAQAARFEQAHFDADVVWLCVGDKDIADTAARMARRAGWAGKTAFHASGALTSEELWPLKSKGAKVASVHPMMSFVRSAEASPEGVSFALEGDAAAMAIATRIVQRLGGTCFKLEKKDKGLYHALGAFSSPLLVAHLAAAEKIGKALGLSPAETRRVIGPILQQTLRNYLEHGAAASFSGPIARGDVDTIRRNLAALKRVRGADEIYRALAKMGIGELPVKRKAAIARLVAG